MFKKLLTGFIVMAVALTGMPMTSDAAVEVGDNLKLFGDFRMRFEFDDRDYEAGNASTADSRERPRIRARFGAKYQSPWEPLSIGLRMTTGANRNSPHDTLSLFNAGSGTSGSTNFGNGLELDRGYAKLKFLESGSLKVGKFGYPLWQQTEVYFDGDISPEGYAASYTASLQEMGSITAVVLYQYLTQNSFQTGFFDNDSVFTWQVFHKGSFNQVKTVVAVSGSHTQDGDNDGDFAPTGTTNTDTSPEPTFYEVSGQVKFAFNELKFLIGGDYVWSDWTETGDDHDTGFVIQGRVKTGPYGIRYYYYDIEEASVLFYGDMSLTQDNFPNSNGSALTGFDGHRIQFDYKIAQNVQTDFRIYIQEGKSNNRFTALAETPNRGVNRYQLNFNVKF